jgi:nicotinamide-nucleotide amidase
MLPPALTDAAIITLNAFHAAGLMLVTAESCTGGLVTAALTAISGASDVVERGFVTYTNDAKTEMLGVDAALLDTHGAVSAPVARAMAEGALTHSHAHIAVSITGIAGPSGGSDDKPVGLVHFACARRDGPTVTHHEIFPGDRDAVREQAVLRALEMARTATQPPQQP